MPELLLRMKIVSEYSLKEIQEIFNYVLNKVHREKRDIMTSDVAALHYFPEVFAKPRDDYITAILHDIANDLQGQENGFSSVTAYLGNLQIKPVSRLWNTYKLGRDYSHA